MATQGLGAEMFFCFDLFCMKDEARSCKSGCHVVPKQLHDKRQHAPSVFCVLIDP
jgi:hypothetical protein